MELNEFQIIINEWMLKCFGPTTQFDKTERNYRFFEEATELVQACGMSKEDCYKLVDYVYNRPVGEVEQEIGGVMVTLAALTTVQQTNLKHCAGKEWERIHKNMDLIRRKQAEKTIKSGPLP